MNVTKQIVVAGVVALALLAMPVGLSVRSEEAGAGLSLVPAATTAYARSGNVAPVKPSGSGTGVAAPSGTQTGGLPSVSSVPKRTEGFQTQKGSQYSDKYCQDVADIMDIEGGKIIDALNADDKAGYLKHFEIRDYFENEGLNHGCAFIN